MASWRELEAAVARRRDAGRPAAFWWRDDDAVAPTPEVERLLALSAASAVPLALAVIPMSASAGLFGLLHAQVTVLQHGTDHANRAGPGEKKTEFPAAEADEQALARLAAAREQLAALGGKRVVPVLAPPWNRLRGALASRLPQAGFSGLSRYGPSATALAGITQLNTHVDIVAWRSGRAFVGEDAALAAACLHLAQDATEPTGWLTHHAVHDEQAWSFLERLFEFTQRCGARWLGAPEAFRLSPAIR